MRGVILAGGTGSRLGVLTKTINKHVLPVGPLPMIFYPLMTLRNNGITDITVVSSSNGVGQIAALLGSGHEHGCTLTYRVQDQPGGIVSALLAAEQPEIIDSVAVILGDNIFAKTPVLPTSFEGDAVVFLSKHGELRQLGVAEFDADKQNIIGIVEKPQNPPSEYAVTGLYLFEADVFHNARAMLPSLRGETEISELLDWYAEDDVLMHKFIDGFWGDAGTVEGMAECAEAVKNAKSN